ncbi:uncharacterized protein [Cherax quadricarinatus]|uniref:uncharacterized protein n=1 Tax=Cherax quadricarinatus TaxID=27406 RepID=UPI00387E6B26
MGGLKAEVSGQTSTSCDAALSTPTSGGGMGVACPEEESRMLGVQAENLAHDSLASLQMLCRRRAPLYPDAKQQAVRREEDVAYRSYRAALHGALSDHRPGAFDASARVKDEPWDAHGKCETKSIVKTITNTGLAL